MSIATRQRDKTHEPRGHRQQEAEGPSDLRGRGWWAVLKRTVAEFRRDNLTDWAAALTYYTVLSIFPAVIVLVSILGLVGQYPQTTDKLLQIVADVGPSSAVDTFRGPIEEVVKNKSEAGVLLVVGLLTALWSASAYIGAFTRASNAIYEIDEGRPFWKLRPVQLLIALAMVLMLAVVGLAVVLTGPVASAVAKPIGLDGAAVTVWNIAKWPVLLGVVMLMLAVLYYWAPNVRQPAFRWISPGSALAVVVWIAASAGFGLYAANFGSYDKTYGSLGGVIVLLVWLWISNVAVLLGAELNAELERERELQSGDGRAHERIQLEPRDDPGRKD
jgi:membrane protein